MRCQECGAENHGGSVFCTCCKSRIVLSEPDVPVPLTDIDRPYFAIQHFGETSSYDVSGFSFRFVTLPLFVGILAVLILLGIAGWITALTAVIWIAAYFSIVYVAVLLYKTKKRPIDLGGSGMSPLPSRSETELIEADHVEKKRID